MQFCFSSPFVVSCRIANQVIRKLSNALPLFVNLFLSSYLLVVTEFIQIELIQTVRWLLNFPSETISNKYACIADEFSRFSFRSSQRVIWQRILIAVFGKGLHRYPILDQATQSVCIEHGEISYGKLCWDVAVAWNLVKVIPGMCGFK